MKNSPLLNPLNFVVTVTTDIIALQNYELLCVIWTNHTPYVQLYHPLHLLGNDLSTCQLLQILQLTETK